MLYLCIMFYTNIQVNSIKGKGESSLRGHLYYKVIIYLFIYFIFLFIYLFFFFRGGGGVVGLSLISFFRF